MGNAARRRGLDLDGFLKELRSIDGLRETTPKHFAFRSRAFLHFHGPVGGRYADVRLGDDWVERPAQTNAELAALAHEVRAYVEANRPSRRRRTTTP